MKLLLPIEFNETNVNEWKNTLSSVVRFVLNQNISRENFAYIVFTVDEPFQKFLLDRYDFLKAEKERNRQRNAARQAGTPEPIQPRNDIPKVRAYERLGIVPIDIVFQNLGKIIQVENHPVTIRSKRYRCYARFGVKCVRCGIEGKYFAAEKSKGTTTEKYHLNLYHLTADNKEILMTVDHIVPLSRGGPDNVSNLWPMCIICNNKKGSLTEEELATGMSHIEAERLIKIEKEKRREKALAELEKVKGKVISISPLTADTECDKV